MSYQEPFVQVIDTNETKKPEIAQFIVKNPLKKDIFVNSIQLSFDSYFSEKGVVMIKINNNIILSQKDAGSYNRIHNFPIPLKNQELLNQQKIEVFAWNGIDNDFVSVGVDIQISEHNDMQIQPDTPLSETMRNLSISKSVILFAYAVYVDQTITALIDMKGNKKLRVFFAGSSYVKNFDILHGGTSIGDGDLVTASFASNGGSLDILNGKIDFGSSALRDVTASVSGIVNNSVGNYLIKLQGSNDNLAWTTEDSINVNPTLAQTTLNSINKNWRYYRIVSDHVSGTNALNQYTHEMYQTSLFGGSASLSFEQLDISSGQWLTVIPSSEFGTVVSGTPIVSEVGDVNTISISGKTYALPSSQSNFRAKLSCVGAIQTGVSITKMS